MKTHTKNCHLYTKQEGCHGEGGGGGDCKGCTCNGHTPDIVDKVLHVVKKIEQEAYQQGFKDGEKKGREKAFVYLEEFFETETQFDHDDLVAMKSNIEALKDK